MRNDLTHVALVVDRSGSMDSCRQEAQEAVNSFVKKQAEGVGECRVTLVEFDNEYRAVYENVLAGDAPRYVLEPRGMTALLDAMGRTIHSVGQSLSNMVEADRPGLVVVVVMTDGHENASKEYTQAKVAEMVKVQQEQYNWQFVFLGANPTVAAAAIALNVPADTSASYSSVADAVGVTSDMLRDARTSRSLGRDVCMAYTADQRTRMGGAR
jgi:hypothetical protein